MIYSGIFFDKDVIETLAPEKLEKTIQFPRRGRNFSTIKRRKSRCLYFQFQKE